MPNTVPGKLTKQGPIATLEGTVGFTDGDKFMFNGSQFVHFVSQAPTAIEASANKVQILYDGQVYSKLSYSNFKNSSNVFRFLDGEPMYTGVYIGTPGAYDHVIIGYSSPITTNQIRFWSANYIPKDFIRVDYSHDGDYFFNVPTSVGDVSFEFDDSIRLYSTEASPRGQYVYTVELNADYTASYWRIRSFIFATNTARVADVNGKTVTLTTVSGLPASSDLYEDGGLYYYVGSIGTSLQTKTFRSSSLPPISGDDRFITYSATNITLDPNCTTLTLNNVRLDNCVGTIRRGSTIKGTCSLMSFPTEYYIAELAEDVVVSSNPDYVDLVFDITYSSVPGYVVGCPNVRLKSIIGNSGNIGFTFSYSAELGLVLSYKPMSSVLYGSLGASSLVGMNIGSFGASDDLEAGSSFVYSYDCELTQVQIVSGDNSQLRYWESDGSKSVTNLLEVDNVYDLSYDVSDEVYYAIRFNALGGFGSPSLTDDFSGNFGSSFDASKWGELGTGFYRDPVAGCAVFNTSSGVVSAGGLISTAYITGNFDASLYNEVATLSGSGFYGFSLIDKDSNNMYGGVFLASNWGAGFSGSVVGVGVSALVNVVSSYVNFSSLSIDPYVLVEGDHKHTLEYSSSLWYYTRESLTPSGVLWDVSDVNVGSGPGVLLDGMSVSLETSAMPPDGSHISFITHKSTASGLSSSTVMLSSSYDSLLGQIIFSFDDGFVSSVLVSEIYGKNFKIGIFGSNSNFTTVSSTLFESSGSVIWTIPCFEVVAINAEGSVTDVPDVTSGRGLAISALDLVQDPVASFGDYYNKVSIATNGLRKDSGGALFLRINSDIYRYEKSDLPIILPEEGSTASVVVSGTLPSIELRHFSYDDYVNGGLSYGYEDSRGVFITTVSSSSLLETGYEAELDLLACSVPLARDPVDYSVLYTLVGNSVYVFNSDDTSVAFCNVISSEPVLPANSNYSSLITAQVTNLYGDPLANKTVNFSITSGAGSLNTASSCTTSSGVATTVFVAGPVEGTSVVTATATNTAC